MAIPTSIGVGARQALAALGESHIDPRPLLVGAGLRGVDLEDPAVRVPSIGEADFIEAAAKATGDPAFGLRLATSGNPRQTGLVYFLLGAAPSVRDVMRRLPQLVPLVDDSIRGSVTLTATGGAALDLRYLAVRRRKLMAATEFHVATVLQHLRDVTGHDLAPCRVSFSHYRNGDFKRFERFFGCPVEFGAEADRLVLSEQSLNLPSLHADPHLFATLGRIADQEVKSRSVPARTFREAVDNYLFRSLPRGEPTAEIVSQALTVSPRTLARRLADEGTSLSELLDDVRHGLAVKYVEQPEISIDQITALLGYAGAASFTHAFHRWTGSSPSAARRDRRADGPGQVPN